MTLKWAYLIHNSVAVFSFVPLFRPILTWTCCWNFFRAFRPIYAFGKKNYRDFSFGPFFGLGNSISSRPVFCILPCTPNNPIDSMTKRIFEPPWLNSEMQGKWNPSWTRRDWIQQNERDKISIRLTNKRGIIRRAVNMG